jgi:hypothetical protein
LIQWFNRRFAAGGTRMRRMGIVGRPRRLAIALWRFLQHGDIPAGAVLKLTLSKVGSLDRRTLSTDGITVFKLSTCP